MTIALRDTTICFLGFRSPGLEQKKSESYYSRVRNKCFATFIRMLKPESPSPKFTEIPSKSLPNNAIKFSPNNFRSLSLLIILIR